MHASSGEQRNVRLLGHCDLGGQGDGMGIQVVDGYAYVGHMGESRVGTSIVDVSNPRDPRVVNQLKTPPGTHSHKVQIAEGHLIVNRERSPFDHAEQWTAGIELFDLSNPVAPASVGFLPMEGKGVHRMTWWGGPYAYMSGSDSGWTDQFLLIADVSDPAHPVEVGRWWYPGMHVAGGEQRTWPSDRVYKHHHPLLRENIAYCPWWDAGLVVLDVRDPASPALVGQLAFPPDESASTHTALPIPGRDVLVVTDEAIKPYGKEIHKDVRIVDICDNTQPAPIAKLPRPEGDYGARGGRFGPHNLHEMRPDSLVTSDYVFLTYFSAGLRIYDIRNPRQPAEVAYYVPPAPRGQPSVQLNDLYVDATGLIYVTDRRSGGLYILEARL